MTDDRTGEDLAKELRDWAHIADHVQGVATLIMLSGEIFNEAADEIERLRKAGDKIAMHLDAHYGEGNHAPVWLADSLAEWKEARRG